MLSLELQFQMQKRGWEYGFDLSVMLREFPTTITLQKKDNGKYNVYCPAVSIGTVEGIETAEEAVAKLWIQAYDFKNSAKKKGKK